MQEYLASQLLVNKKKVDLRYYMAITSFNPYVVVMYDIGYTRTAQKEFNENIDVDDLS